MGLREPKDGAPAPIGGARVTEHADLARSRGLPAHSGERAPVAGGPAARMDIRSAMDYWANAVLGGGQCEADPGHAALHRALEAFTRELLPVEALDDGVREVFVRTVASLALHRDASAGKAVRRLMEPSTLYDAALLAHIIWSAAGRTASAPARTPGYL